MENVTLSSWIALTIGFLHALEPGHGKTALFTFLASGQKTWREGIVISLSSALTHSAAVFFIAFLSHFILHHSATEDGIKSISSFLSYISGGLIFALGIWVILKVKRGDDLHANCCGTDQSHNHGHEHSHNHDHSHKHSHNHDHEHEQKMTKSGFLASGLIGVATGIIPCPTVIVAYLGGVSTGNSYVGMQSVGFFAFGMFLALMLVVLAFNFGGQKLIERVKFKKVSTFNWGYIQGCVFLVIGVFTAFMH